MAVMIPRETSTEQRLQDLEKKVDVGFAEMKGRFEGLEGRFEGMEKRFTGLEDRFASLERRFENLEERFGALNHTLIGGFAVIVATLIGSSVF